MACNSNTSSSATSRGYIYDTILKIDQMQKAAEVEHVCDGCDSSLVGVLYNTKPVSFTLCSGVQFSAIIPDGTPSGQITSFFRIESIRNDAVILRLMNPSLLGPDPIENPCSDCTAVLNISCICGLQCFPPVCCNPCQKVCGPSI